MGKNEQKLRSRLIAAAFSFLFSAAILFGARLDDVENVDVKDITLWLQLAAFTVIFTGVVLLLWQFLDVLGKRERKDGRKVPNIIAGVIERAGGYEEVLSFLFLILCWLPVFLAVYPGFFVYDAQDEYIQVATRTFSTHHPLVHVLLLGGVVCGIHKLTDSYNMGIACYTVFQMAQLRAFLPFFFPIFAKKVSRVIRLIGIVWLGLFPTVVMFTLCSAKDALFTLALLLLLVCLLEMGTEEPFFDKKGWQLLFVLAGTG